MAGDEKGKTTRKLPSQAARGRSMEDFDCREFLHGREFPFDRSSRGKVRYFVDLQQACDNKLRGREGLAH